ncbi:MAG TPA: enoyl-CoA hydratase [Acidimicrobiales bacterium]|nr:enoyl-CoA hydratase [Acidimicrobiales bacterium]
MSDDVVLSDVSDRIGTVTMHRPEARNALNSALRSALPKALLAMEANDDVDVIILTGTDPAFCAGLDLKELGSGGNDLGGGSKRAPAADDPVVNTPWPTLTKPVIGAVNGVSITGGFELALNCDFLIASEHARFADTHSRVGVMPGWGLTVLLPQAIGVRRAREMSTTGNFMGATEALTFGLVNHVVPHDELIPFTRQIATDIIGNDQTGVRRMLETYRATSGTTIDEGWQVEARMAREWQAQRFDPAEVERRRQAIIDRGRTQV